METVKNFFTGAFVLLTGFILAGLIFLTWPVLIGITSLFLSILSVFLFVSVVFYIVVLVGHLTRMLITRR